MVRRAAPADIPPFYGPSHPTWREMGRGPVGVDLQYDALHVLQHGSHAFPVFGFRRNKGLTTRTFLPALSRFYPPSSFLGYKKTHLTVGQEEEEHMVMDCIAVY